MGLNVLVSSMAGNGKILKEWDPSIICAFFLKLSMILFLIKKLRKNYVVGKDRPFVRLTSMPLIRNYPQPSSFIIWMVKISSQSQIKKCSSSVATLK